MTDIVERLRRKKPVYDDREDHFREPTPLELNAANVIEKLRNELLDAGEMLFNQAKTIQSLQAALDRYLEYHRKWNRKHRANMTDEDRAKKREYDRERQRALRARMTAEERRSFNVRQMAYYYRKQKIEA